MKPLLLKAAMALLVVGFISVTGCASVRTREDLQPDERWVYTVRELPGRGERVRGELQFRSSRLPHYFSEVVIGERRFTMALRAADGDMEGYREDLHFSRIAEARALGHEQSASAAEPLSDSARRRGWYLGGLHERRPDTPDDWIWVRRENLEAWVNPRRVEAFATSYQLGAMNAQPQPRFQFMFSYGVQR